MTLNPVSRLSKLDVVNRVLQEAGERTVSAITDNTAAWKVAGMLYSCISIVNDELPWEELIVNKALNDADITTENSTSVLNNLLGYNLSPTVSDLVEVVYLHNSTTNKPVNYLEWHRMQGLGYATATAPEYWTYYRGLLFTYPEILVANRGSFMTAFTGSVDVPVLDSDRFSAPDYLIELYIKRLLYQFSQRHLANNNLTVAVYQEYVTELQKYAAKYKITPKTIRTGLSIPDTNFIGTPQPQQQR